MTGQPEARTPTILLVDDEEMIRASTRRMLERRGYAVVVACDARQALELLEQTAVVDLLLTDVVMPEIYGTDLIRLARERRPGLPAILMSGFADQRNARHDAVPAGVPFLSKPFSLPELLAQVRAVIGGPGPG